MYFNLYLAGVVENSTVASPSMVLKKKTMVPPLLSIQGPTRQVQGLQGHLQDVQEQLQDHLEAPQRPFSDVPECLFRSIRRHPKGRSVTGQKFEKFKSKISNFHSKYVNQKSLCRARTFRGARELFEPGPLFEVRIATFWVQKFISLVENRS